MIAPQATQAGPVRSRTVWNLTKRFKQHNAQFSRPAWESRSNNVFAFSSWAHWILLHAWTHSKGQRVTNTSSALASLRISVNRMHLVGFVSSEAGCNWLIEYLYNLHYCEVYYDDIDYINSFKPPQSESKLGCLNLAFSPTDRSGEEVWRPQAVSKILKRGVQDFR